MTSRARAASQAAAWDDLDRVPEEFVGEIVNGEVVMNARPDAPHVDAQSDLGGLLVGWFRFGSGGPGGWVIRIEPRIRFGDDIRVPDLAGWHKDRFVSPRKGPYTVVPDWICEILSESTAAADRTEKMPLYARLAVLHLWLLDPIVRTLEVYRLEHERWVVAGTWAGSAKARAEPFEAVELDLTLVWGQPASEPAAPGDEPR
jgi:Uma2 family endonuclease